MSDLKMRLLDPDVPRDIANAAGALLEENDRLREFIAASKECADGAALLELQAENDRIRKACSDAVNALKSDMAVRIGTCTWCDESWLTPDGSPFEEVAGVAHAHDTACPKNPLRIERDALRTAVIDVADLQLRRSDLLVQIRAYRQAANDLREPFSDAKVERLVEEFTKEEA